MFSFQKLLGKEDKVDDPLAKVVDRCRSAGDVIGRVAIKHS